MLIDDLKTVLATNFALYLKAHNYHWNVEGANFSELHAFFGGFYEAVWGNTDLIAEEIRKLGSYAPGSLSRFAELSLIKDNIIIPDDKTMIRILASDNDLLIGALYKAHASAEAGKKFGTVNLIEGLIDQHEKWAWQLKAFK